jgi:hypothetical protein
MHHHRMLSVLARLRDAAGRPQVVVKSRTLQSGEQAGDRAGDQTSESTGADCVVARQ